MLITQVETCEWMSPARDLGATPTRELMTIHLWHQRGLWDPAYGNTVVALFWRMSQYVTDLQAEKERGTT